MFIRYFSILFCFLLFACNASKTAQVDKAPELETQQKVDPYITFEVSMHDFGEMKKGDKKTFIYKFTNTGKEDVVFELVSGCECTTLEWPEGKTFKPGDSGEIKATFNSETEEGAVTKTIDILLENVDPSSGYQIIKEVKYKAIILE